ncbi:MAG: hypothetical protein HQ518_18035 [Rhodopirellula sp.]|nr:hypothetical protein [Rhodopirellula sp.]
MIRWQRWKPRNSTLWRTSAAFWLLNAAFNGVTAGVARTPSVYFALGGINVFLATLSYFVSCRYRQAEQLPGTSTTGRHSSGTGRAAPDLTVE